MNKDGPNRGNLWYKHLHAGKQLKLPCRSPVERLSIVLKNGKKKKHNLTKKSAPIWEKVG
ncbi:MAG: hypothetical protein AB4352_09570 [Hormoscilla sp.]